jgi:hypothetical protein
MIVSLYISFEKVVSLHILAWTGVALANPIDETASRDHSGKPNELQDRGSLFAGFGSVVISPANLKDRNA